MMSMMAIHLLLLLLQGEMARRMADDVRQRNLALEAELRLSRESERAAKASAALLRNLAPGSSQATNANANSGAVPGAASDTGAAAHQSSPPISTATPTPTSPLVPLRKKPMTSAEVALAFAPTEEDKQREVEAAATAFRADQERLEAEAQRESRFQAAVAEKVGSAYFCVIHLSSTESFLIVIESLISAWCSINLSFDGLFMNQMSTIFAARRFTFSCLLISAFRPHPIHRNYY